MKKFKPIPEKILNSKDLLTKGELDLIDASVNQCHEIISICGDSDDDVLEYHLAYLHKLEKRIINSLKSKRLFDSKLRIVA